MVAYEAFVNVELVFRWPDLYDDHRIIKLVTEFWSVLLGSSFGQKKLTRMRAHPS